MATSIEGVGNAPALTRDGKAKANTPGEPKQTDRSGDRESAIETAHTVELSPESVSKAQKIVTGSGYITPGDLGNIEFTDEQVLELSAEIGRQMEKRSGGLVQPPSAELAGMIE